MIDELNKSNKIFTKRTPIKEEDPNIDHDSSNNKVKEDVEPIETYESFKDLGITENDANDIPSDDKKSIKSNLNNLSSKPM